MKKALILLGCMVLLIAPVMLLVGCFGGGRDTLDPETSVVLTNRFYAEHRQQEPLGAGVPHERARQTVTVPVNPERIIVFGLGELDTLLYLGLQDRVVGIACFGDSMPAHLQAVFGNRTRVAGLGVANSDFPHNPNYQLVAGLNPDLIIIEGRQRAGRGDTGHFQRLSAVAPTLDFGLTTGHMLRDTFYNLSDLAKIFPDIADDVASVKTKINAEIKKTYALAQTVNQRVLMVLKNNNAYSILGREGRWSFIFNELGLGEGITGLGSGTHGAAASESVIIANANNIDMIFIVDRNNANPTNTLMSHTIFNRLPAVPNNVHLFNSDWYMINGGGVQFFLTQIAQVYEILSAI